MAEDAEAALAVINELYQRFIPLASAAVQAAQDGSVGTLEGVGLALRAVQLAREVTTLVEATAQTLLPEVLEMLDHSEVLAG